MERNILEDLAEDLFYWDPQYRSEAECGLTCIESEYMNLVCQMYELNSYELEWLVFAMLV